MNAGEIRWGLSGDLAYSSRAVGAGGRLQTRPTPQRDCNAGWRPQEGDWPGPAIWNEPVSYWF